ncbi:PREDICTED: equilibrative nucleotide transporter 1-like [Tarenaya hassleriana]|uniref:equilibrative nucleotide transporter 1-like n=1 Tax=Tarenaya hassleriana TaxID=28532 RepID=UPI00053C8AC0|nr:PREDICTED: equilibrative nucleotide transporter 1-like [Tarenaya hassleriana]XP_010533133.1 PREDICTED: equilibrative nucleotide transporter 1-like [Tarenaya hassleriana]
MGLAGKPAVAISDRLPESSLLLIPHEGSICKIPSDSFHFAYIIYFTLGVGFLLPWNAFITAVDYFSYLYPAASVDRIFAVIYMLVGLVFLLLIVVFYAHKYNACIRINLGLSLFVVTLLVVPIMDLVYIKGRVGLYAGFDVTAVAVALSGIADALMQGGLIGVAGQLPERYMQAVLAGTAGSGVLVSFLRILTKAVYPQDPDGLRKSANLYFAVGIVVMVICFVFYNVADRLPVIKYYDELKNEAINEEKQAKGSLTGSVWRKTLWEIVVRVKSYGFGIVLIYIVTLSIFPGFITEDVHSESLKDWYPVLLIAAYNVFDLVGKSLTAVIMLEDEKIAVGGCIARLLFYPLFWGCLHGPRFLRTEIPVTLLTCLLGLTNGYLASVLMILAPKSVQLKHSETAGIVTVLFLVTGLAAGSILAWFWVV